MTSSVTATFVFTDLVDSTALAARLGPEGAEELRVTHFGLLGGAVEAAGGVVVKNLGDGLMVMFTSPSAALGCAVGMEQAVERYNRSAEEPLGIRVGISVGEATEEDGDFFGDPVVEAARLCAKADGGQILATQLVQVLAGKRTSVVLSPLGEMTLKGLPDPVEVVEVIWEPEVIDDGAGVVPLPDRIVVAAASAVFVGRDGALGELEVVVKRSAADRVVELVLVSGEAGIGKSTLVAHAARKAHADGALVFFGHSDEGLGIAYQPWIEVIEQLVDADPTVVDGLLPVQRAVLGRLVPSLAVEGLGQVEAGSERLVLVRAITRLFEEASTRASAPVFVELDDLHWADQATLSLLSRLVTAGLHVPLVIVGTFRHTDIAAGDGLSTLLADLHRVERVTRIGLDGLGDRDLLEFMATVAGHELSDDAVGLAHALARGTGGNPFFVAEMLRHLRDTESIIQDDTGHWRMSEDLAVSGLPTSVRDVVGRRVGRLGADAGRVLSVAAVIGQSFDIDLLAAVAEIDVDGVLDILEEAERAAIVVEDDEANRFRFTHALMQQTLLDDSSATRRQRTHRKIAETIEAAPDAGVGHTSELAMHWIAATRPSDVTKALLYAERAGDEALASVAPVDAAVWYGKAVELLDSHGVEDDRTRCRLLVGVGQSQWGAGVVGFQVPLRSARVLARKLDDIDLLVAALREHPNQSVEPRDPERLGHVDYALEHIPPDDTPSRVDLLVAQFQALGGTAYDERITCARALIDLANTTGEDDAAATAATFVEFAQVPLADALKISDAGIAACSRNADAYRLSSVLVPAPGLALTNADIETFRQQVRETIELAVALDLPNQTWWATSLRAFESILKGDLEAAEMLLDEALALGTACGHLDAVATYVGNLVVIRTQQGRLGEVVGFMADAARDTPDRQVLQAAVVMIHADLGHLDEVRLLLAPLSDSGVAAIPRDSSRLTALSCYASAAVAAGDTNLCRLLRDELLPHTAQITSVTGSSARGAAAHDVALLDQALGDLDQADAHFAQSLDLHERIEAPYFIAMTQVAWAEMLTHRDQPGDTEHARELATAAHAIAHQYHFPVLIERAAAIH